MAFVDITIKDTEIVIKTEEGKETKVGISGQSVVVITLERGVRVYSDSNHRLMVENEEQPEGRSISLWVTKPKKETKNEP